MNAIRAAREQANPNFGFQRQLQNFEHTTVKKVNSVQVLDNGLPRIIGLL